MLPVTEVLRAPGDCGRTPAPLCRRAGAEPDRRRAERSARRRRAVAVLRAYVALTKPRIIELLLVTTVPTMVLAAGGLPPLGLVLATLVGGSLAAGSANALNCYLDRDIDAVMRRTVSRPLARHAVSAALGAGLRRRARRGRGRDDVGLHRLAAGAAHRLRDPLLRPGLHAGAQAPDPAEHRVGRRGRLHAGADRLGRGDRLAGLAAGGALRGDLLLDPAALLAAGDAVPRRLRAGRGADAAGRGHPGRGGPADRRLQPGSRWPPRCCCGRWPPRGSTARPRSAAGAWFLVAAHRLLGHVRRAAREPGGRGVEPQAVRLFHLSNSYLALLFVAVAVDALVR